jgi:hypothetical protein
MAVVPRDSAEVSGAAAAAARPFFVGGYVVPIRRYVRIVREADFLLG